VSGYLRRVPTNEQCPKCGERRGMLLVGMRRHGYGRDWFCCDACNWLFSAEHRDDVEEPDAAASDDSNTRSS
jgi:rubredoxin